MAIAAPQIRVALENKSFKKILKLNFNACIRLKTMNTANVMFIGINTIEKHE